MPKKISELPAAGAIAGTEVVPGVQSGSTVKLLLSALKTWVLQAADIVAAIGSTAVTNAANATTVTGSVASTATGTTQTVGDNSTKIATTAYADRAAGNVANSNYLPNCQWQLFATGYVVKQTESGTGDQVAVSCTGFQTSNNNPLFYTSNTQEIKAGDIVRIYGGGFKWGFTGAGYVSTEMAVRVSAVNPGVSIQIAPVAFGGVTPAVSAACTMSPITGGVAGTGSGQCADMWKKSPTLMSWADDFTSNACIGAIRTLGVRKGVGSLEQVSFEIPAAQFGRWRGRTVTFGVLVYQKVQAGAGTWSPYVYDSVALRRNGTAGTGVSYSDPTYGHFEFRSVTATISSAATQIQFGIDFSGAAGDVYYVALPNLYLGTTMTREQLHQIPNEVIRPVGHWNPPILTPFAIEFPATAFPGTGGVLYGYDEIDIEAISMGMCHKSIPAVKCKIEYLSSTVGSYFFTGSKLDYSLVFGPQSITCVAGVNNVDSGWLPLTHDGKMCVFTNTASLFPTSVTFDFDMVQLSMPVSVL